MDPRNMRQLSNALVECKVRVKQLDNYIALMEEDLLFLKDDVEGKVLRGVIRRRSMERICTLNEISHIQLEMIKLSK